MRNKLVQLVDDSNPNSLGSYFRKKRIKVFVTMLNQIQANPISILDVGGRSDFWENMSDNIDITKLNITITNLEDNRDSNTKYRYIQADARKLPFKDKEFDVVFSNSVIEHIEGSDGVTFIEQKKMAEEVLRVGNYFYIQTPNYWFPFEPHFLFPFFQFLPFFLKIWLVQNFSLGWFEKCKYKKDAERLIKSIRLLNLKEMRELFPSSNTYKEKIFVLTKSITKYGPVEKL